MQQWHSLVLQAWENSDLWHICLYSLLSFEQSWLVVFTSSSISTNTANSFCKLSCRISLTLRPSDKDLEDLYMFFCYWPKAIHMAVDWCWCHSQAEMRLDADIRAEARPNTLEDIHCARYWCRLYLYALPLLGCSSLFMLLWELEA